MLCPTDFSDNAAAALEVGVAVAQAAQAKLLIVHIARPPVRRSGRAGCAPAPAQVVGPPADPVKELARFGETAAAAGVEAERLLREGDPAEEIVAQARRAGADLIVMGRHSRGASDHWFVGSVTDCVVRTAPCPVMVVKPLPRVRGRQPRQVVCALDLGQTSAATIAHAVTLANTLQADLLVLHVVGSPGAGPHEPAPCGAAAAAPDPVQKARTGLAALIASAPIPKGRVRQQVVIGSPPHEILGAASANGTDLVVIGSHAGTIRDRQFIGSTTVHLLRHAGCDVLIVPAAMAGAEKQDRTRSSEEAKAPPPRSLGRAR